MIKKTITYETFDGGSVTEDFYFNMSKAELVELEISQKDGFGEALQRMIKSEDNMAILEAFKSIIMMSIGRKSDDGKRFIKNDQIRDEFMQTNAYSELFFEIAQDADQASSFIRGILPSSLNADVPEPENVPLPEDPKEMTREELLEAYKAKLSE
jgi:hypothetical protein